MARREDDLEAIDLLTVVQDHVDRSARVPLGTGRTVVHALAGDEVRFEAVSGDRRRRTVFDCRESADVVGMRMGDEDRREVLRLHMDVCEIVDHLARVGVRRCVHQDQSIIDEESRRRICLDHMHAFEEFHSRHPRVHMRSAAYSFRGIGFGPVRFPQFPPVREFSSSVRIGFLCLPDLPATGCGMALADVLGRVEADAEKALETLKEYCRFPTISAHKRAQPETAAFVRRLLVENGFEAREYPTEGGPNVVFGQMIVDERKPTLMMYQHYDVQPVDPLNEWKRDPFDPTIQDGKFWGRGCGDTKGNLIMQLLAVQAWRAIEGRDHLHEGTPKIELGCKGILYVEMVSRTASVDQHSSYAAIAPNPSWRLMHALMTLRDAKGRIKIAGWYEDARRPTARELRFLKSSVFSAQALKEYWGVSEFIGGDNDFELLRRLIYSPTCTICGFVSGYSEQGTKTVNPAAAKPKIDFRH